MKYLITLLITITSIACIAQKETYHRIKIFANDSELRLLQQNGLSIDHGNYRKGVSFESDFSNVDLEIIKKTGIDYQIVIEDVKSYYLSRNKASQENKSSSSKANECNLTNANDFKTPDNWELGSMGGYFTYDEYIEHLDSMYSKYPNLITQRDTVDTITSHEGKPIYWLKISDNPNMNENEPEIMYTALHHAREAASLSQTIMYMYYLLENYGTDDEVTYLVDNTEMYFIPMVNPDGYIYNHTTDPNGGGMWRKNRRNNGDGTMGVDLNRNYGHEWGRDNNGSSPNTNSDTYRGPEPFSEPETKATKWFSENYDIIACLNYHTYGNLLIYPWGYEESAYTPDSAIFVEYAKILTEANNYNYGTGDQTVGYVTNGDSDDWMYADQNILSFTPEAGESGDGFWPATSRIEPISKENIRQNLNLAWLVNKYAFVEDVSNSYFETLDIYIPVKTKRLGYDATGVYEVSLTSLDSYTTVTNSPFIYSNLAHLESRTDSFLISLDNSIAEGQEFKLQLSINNGTSTFIDTLTKVFGTQSNLFTNSGTSLDGFASTGEWGITSSDYFSSPSSISDSPNGNYDNNSNTSIYVSNEVDLTLATQASINFMAKWEIESGYDYVQIMASNDNGSNWSPLCGNYTKSGTADQDQGQPLYDGYQVNWIEEEVSLNNYIGEKVKVQFRLVSDVWSTADGFFFDDFKINIIGDVVSGLNNSTEMEESQFLIFPNPNSGSFNLNTKNNTFDIEIYNNLGQRIYDFNSINNRSFSINNLKRGSYIIKLTSNQISVSELIIVN